MAITKIENSMDDLIHLSLYASEAQQRTIYYISVCGIRLTKTNFSENSLL